MSLEVSSCSPFVEIYLNIVAKGQGGGGVGRGLFYFGQTFIGYPFYWCKRVEGKESVLTEQEEEKGLPNIQYTLLKTWKPHGGRRL